MIRLLILFLYSSCSLFAKHELAVCTIFQNDAAFLKEWIEFHKLQGVQHFYLYDNNSRDHFSSVLDPYIARGDVTLINWPYTYANNDDAEWRKIQFGAYMDCIHRFGNGINWLAVIDSDEFLFCPTGEQLPSFLKRYLSYGGVCVNWVRFGTSHVEEIPPGNLMIELLTLCNQIENRDRLFVKSIVQPQYVTECINAHKFRYSDGKYAVNSAKEKVESTISHRCCIEEIRINHYWTRTEKYFREFKMPSRHKRRNAFNHEKMEKMAKSCNQTTDTDILQYADRLRKAMFP